MNNRVNTHSFLRKLILVIGWMDLIAGIALCIYILIAAHQAGAPLSEAAPLLVYTGFYAVSGLVMILIAKYFDRRYKKIEKAMQQRQAQGKGSMPYQRPVTRRHSMSEKASMASHISYESSSANTAPAKEKSAWNPSSGKTRKTQTVSGSEFGRGSVWPPVDDAPDLSYPSEMTDHND